MPDLSCPTPVQPSIDDQLICIVRIARAAGFDDGAEWIQRQVDETRDRIIADFDEPVQKEAEHSPISYTAPDAIVPDSFRTDAAKGFGSGCSHCLSAIAFAANRGVAGIDMESMTPSEERAAKAAKKTVPPSPPSFTAEEARERADRCDIAEATCLTVVGPCEESTYLLAAKEHARFAITLRHYADMKDRDDAREGAAGVPMSSEPQPLPADDEPPLTFEGWCSPFADDDEARRGWLLHQKEMDVLRVRGQRLREYVKHRLGCRILLPMAAYKPCTCGLAELLTAKEGK